MHGLFGFLITFPKGEERQILREKPAPWLPANARVLKYILAGSRNARSTPLCLNLARGAASIPGHVPLHGSCLPWSVVPRLPVKTPEYFPPFSLTVRAA